MKKTRKSKTQKSKKGNHTPYLGIIIGLIFGGGMVLAATSDFSKPTGNGAHPPVPSNLSHRHVSPNLIRFSWSLPTDSSLYAPYVFEISTDKVHWVTYQLADGQTSIDLPVR